MNSLPAIFAFFAATAGATDLYRCAVDGKTVYSDRPCVDGQKLPIQNAPDGGLGFTPRYATVLPKANAAVTTATRTVGCKYMIDLKKWVEAVDVDAAGAKKMLDGLLADGSCSNVAPGAEFFVVSNATTASLPISKVRRKGEAAELWVVTGMLR